MSDYPPVPRYLHQRHQLIQESAPGHRFGPYFADWGAPGLSLDGVQLQTLKDQKVRALDGITRLPQATRRLIEAISARQRLAATTADSVVTPVVTTSPLVTGLGLEHPVENGFSFLSPYGVPYLPGSGLKGVFRQAAEQLCFDGTMDFLDLWCLFGFDGSSGYFQGASANRYLPVAGREQLEAYLDWATHLEDDDRRAASFYAAVADRETRQAFGTRHRDWLEALTEKRWRSRIQIQGSLRFWDSFPDATQLAVDVLTPHYGEYYQQAKTPNDSGQPRPTPFLVLPPGTRFDLIIEFQGRSWLPECGGPTWKESLARIQEEALFHGFGGKTAVGYGQVRHR